MGSKAREGAKAMSLAFVLLDIGFAIGLIPLTSATKELVTKTTNGGSKLKANYDQVCSSLGNSLTVMW